MNLRKISRISGLGAVALGLWACTNVGVVPIGEIQEPREKNCSLDFYSAENEIERAFKVVCLIDARTGTTAFHDGTGAAAVRHARPAACKCGADGIIVMKSTQEDDSFGYAAGVANLKAIKYVDGE